MPSRLEVPSLESIALNNIPGLVATLVNTLNKQVDSEYRSGAKKCQIDRTVDRFIDKWQQLLIDNVPASFHIRIISEILMTISDIILGNKCIEHWQSGHLSPEITSGLSLEVRRLNWLQREAVLRSLRMIVHPGLRVINTAALNLGACIVEQITGFLPELTQLTELNLGSLNCRNNNLLTACNPFPGWEFQLLPNLSRVSLTGLSAAALQSLCLFSTNLSSLELINTDVNDDGIASICRLKKLEHFSSSCEGGHVISPYGFAELLRNLPELRSIGRCDSFGEVLTTLYSKWSLYHRSVGSLPKILALENIDCRGPITGQEISFINLYCPNIRSLSFSYTWRHRPELNEGFGNLSGLSSLTKLKNLTVNSADFYSHSLFSAVRTGRQLTSLGLSNIDEMNLNAVIMIGQGCPNLETISLSCCHYTVERGDTAKMAEMCTETERSASNAPFQRLSKATFIITTPTQIPLLKYPVFFARDLKDLRLNKIYQPLEDGFVQALLSWNPMKSLERMELMSGPQLTIMAANMLIQACPVLKYIGKVSTWGRVDREEMEAVQAEIRRRNLDLVLE